MLEEDKFDRYLGNSLFVGIVSTVITLALGCTAAYGLARFRFKGRTTIAYTTLLLRTVPLAVLAIPVFLIWSEVPGSSPGRGATKIKRSRANVTAFSMFRYQTPV